jgi:hypothetical protein
MTLAIQNLSPNSEFSYQEDDYSTINWINLIGDAPTIEQINKEIENIKSAESTQAENNANARQAILDRLGITVDEAKLILG